MVIPINTNTLESTKSEISALSNARRGNALMNNALAGVGKPIKLSACLVSTLNFASRSAENIAIKKAI